jgi:hypothetical protein
MGRDQDENGAGVKAFGLFGGTRRLMPRYRGRVAAARRVGRGSVCSRETHDYGE